MARAGASNSAVGTRGAVACTGLSRHARGLPQAPGSCGRVSGEMTERRPTGLKGEGERMSSYVLDLQEIDLTQIEVVGGKGAHLGELSRIQGIRVPAGFCVTTDAFRRIMEDAPSIDDRLDRLSHLNPDDREAIRTLSAE